MNRKNVYIFGNWKMNKTLEETKCFIKELYPNIKTMVKDLNEVKIGLSIPFISLDAAINSLTDKSLMIGAQNMHFKDNGAFTGEISPIMLKGLGIDFVIIGHSERRHVFNETDEMINQKIKAAIANDIKVIFCIGETLEENENKKTEEVLLLQIKNGLKNIDVSKSQNNIIIAYEPVWAIGTGKKASIDLINQIHSFIKKVLLENYQVSLPILYGGSVKPNNSKEILTQDNVDGVLVGGASLNPADFINIIKSYL